MAVGLSWTSNGWYWENGQKVNMSLTLWDKNKKHILNGNYDHFGCVNIYSKKFEPFPSYLMKFVICEYTGLLYYT